MRVTSISHGYGCISSYCTMDLDRNPIQTPTSNISAIFDTPPGSIKIAASIPNMAIVLSLGQTRTLCFNFQQLTVILFTSD